MKSLKNCFLPKMIQYMMLLAICCLAVSCGDDDDPGTGGSDTGEPISSFQFEVSDTDWRVVNFTNFSQNADSFTWDFGDGNTSTDRDPQHSYDAGGDYEVTLTASDGTASKASRKTIEIKDPNAATLGLTGETSKVWKLSRSIDDEFYPMLVAPANESEIWWAFGREGDGDIATRPCVMNEEYHFGTDGTFRYVTDGTVWADDGVWAGEAACVDDTDPSLMVGPNGEDLLAWGAGEFTFEYDVNAGLLTVNGLGAHIGLAKVATSGEVKVPQSSVTYIVKSIETDGPISRMTLETTLPDPTNPGIWRFNLVSYDNPADEPPLGDPMPVAGFSTDIENSTVTFTNTSSSSDSYFWEFGDGNTSTEESPVHTYSSDGSYTVKLTATSSVGESTSEQTIIISANSVFSAETLHGGTSKVWKLNPAAGALAVGPGEANGDWFQTSADDVVTRACSFDDTYTFDVDGNFRYQTNGDLWAETYMGVDADGCIAEVDLPTAAQPWGSGDHTYTYEETGDSFLTVQGTGAFIALPKAFNGGEYSSPEPVIDGSVRYKVHSYVNDGVSELVVLTLNIGGEGFWSFTLIAE